MIETAGRHHRLRLWFTGQSQSEAARSVRELEVEATSLFERTDNALKLIGDQYLSRVFGLASARFHLDEWQQSIRRKLETVGDVADLLVEQGTSRRMEAPRSDHRTPDRRRDRAARCPGTDGVRERQALDLIESEYGYDQARYSHSRRHALREFTPIGIGVIDAIDLGKGFELWLLDRLWSRYSIHK